MINILLVEDDLILIGVLEQMLNYLVGKEHLKPVTIVKAMNWSEVESSLTGVIRFDVAIFDGEIPGGDGNTVKFVARLGREQPNCQIIANSGHDEILAAQKQAGAHYDTGGAKSEAPKLAVELLVKRRDLAD